MSNRRDFISIAAGAAAVGPLAVSAQSLPSFGSIKALSAKSLGELRTELRTALPAEEPEIRAWLGRFEPGIDARSTATVLAAGDAWQAQAANGRFLYDPLLTEAHLRSASSLLDQALAYRNELAGLEIAGFNAATQYLASIQSIAVADKLVEVQSAGFTSGADKERRKLQKDQITIAANTSAAYRAELLQAGGASNFAERYQRLVTYYLEDLRDAYLKCVAASVGLAARHGQPGPAPAEFRLPLLTAGSPPGTVREFLAPSALDALVAWTRAAIRKLELVAQDEFDYTLTFSMRQNIRKVAGAPAPTGPAQMTGFAPVVSGQEWNDAVDLSGKKGFQFTVDEKDLRDQLFADGFDLAYARVLAVGVQYALANNATWKDQAPVYQALVTPPAQKVMEDRVVTRPPLLIGRVEPASQGGRPAPAVLEADELVLNAPVIGKWDVRLRSTGIALNPLAPTGNTFLPGPFPRHGEILADVFVTMRVRARAVRV